MRPLVSVIMPVRAHESVMVAMESLMRQTVQDFEVHIVVDHEGRGQSWARNRAADSARGEFLLFSDSDIRWAPDAIERMCSALASAHLREAAAPDGWRTGYAYTAYEFLNEADQVVQVVGDQDWSWAALQRNNYISTMVLLKRRYFIGFDEDLRRLEDHDLFLRLGHRYKICGVRTPGICFSTKIRPGISFPSVGGLTHEMAEQRLRQKHAWMQS